MALKLQDGPADGFAVVRAELSQLEPLLRVSAPGWDAATSAERKILPPLPVYELSLDDVASGRPLGGAEQRGWSYLIVQGEEPLAAAAIVEGEGGNSRFSHLSRGPLV